MVSVATPAASPSAPLSPALVIWIYSFLSTVFVIQWWMISLAFKARCLSNRSCLHRRRLSRHSLQSLRLHALSHGSSRPRKCHLSSHPFRQTGRRPVILRHGLPISKIKVSNTILPPYVQVGLKLDQVVKSQRQGQPRGFPQLSMGRLQCTACQGTTNEKRGLNRVNIDQLSSH